MFKYFVQTAILFPTLIFLGGCVSSHQYAPKIDLTYNNNECPSDKACVYVIRPASIWGGGIQFNVTDGGVPVGVTGPSTYLAWERDPGNVDLHAQAENLVVYDFKAEAGQTYYILQTVDPGLLSVRNNLIPISREEAVKYLNVSLPAGN